MTKKNRETESAAETTDKATAKPIAGIVIKEAMRMSMKRPVQTLRARFFELKRGMAYPVSTLSQEWAVSAETIRRHAIDSECFRYVDTTGHDNWEPCVMHPETAESYPTK